jgi:rSAM/selenodomain-associated transferase 1
MSCGVAIFVKTPSLSPVKTRLWPDIGRHRAEALYLISAEAVASVAQQARGMQPYWAVAESGALHTDAWLDLPHLPQGDGSLGERMAHVYQLLRKRHHAAILVGADAPQLTAGALCRAADWLSCVESRLVMGRAGDGGFWLFGGNEALPDRAWTGVRYSVADTATQFARAMQASGRWLELETLRDIDTAADIPHVLSSLSALHAPTAAQICLADWLAKLPASEACA